MTKIPTDSQWANLVTRVKGKQDTLTFDSAPTSGSTNPVTSGGVYTAIGNVESILATLNSGTGAA